MWHFSGADTTGGIEGEFNSLRIAPNGRIHASYYRDDAFDESLRNLKYATNFSPRGAGPWTKVIVDNSMSTGTYSSIALSGTNVPHIAYYDSYLGHLKHAWYDSTTAAWKVEPVDETGTVGQYASIAMSGETVYISYFDATRHGLKLATKPPAGPWTFTLIDTAGTVGLYTSIVSTGTLHISYYDLTNRNLKYAKKVGATWQVVTLDSFGDVGRYTSIASTPTGGLFIAYYDFSNKDLKLAESPGDGSWTLSPVETTGDVGKGASLAVDRDARPHIIYQDVLNQDLRYAARHHGLWIYNTIASTGDVGQYCALAIDLENLPNLLYYDGTQGKLRFAYGTGNQTAVDPGKPEVTPAPRIVLQAHPNPMNPVTTIDLSTTAGERVALRVFDVRGELIRDLFDGVLGPGTRSFLWDGKDDAGRPVASGAYLVAAASPRGRVTEKLIVLR